MVYVWERLAYVSLVAVGWGLIWFALRSLMYRRERDIRLSYEHDRNELLNKIAQLHDEITHLAATNQRITEQAMAAMAALTPQRLAREKAAAREAEALHQITMLQAHVRAVEEENTGLRALLERTQGGVISDDDPPRLDGTDRLHADSSDAA